MTRPSRLLTILAVAALAAAACKSSSPAVGQFQALTSNMSNGDIWALNRPIQVVFNNEIDPLSINFSSFILRPSDTQAQGRPVAGSFTLGPDSEGRVNRVITFIPVCPTNNLGDNGSFQPGGIGYELLLPTQQTSATVLRDTAGHNLGAGLTRNFVTPTPPTEPLFSDTVNGPPVVTGITWPVSLNLFSQEREFIQVRFNQSVDASPNSLNLDNLYIQYSNVGVTGANTYTGGTTVNNGALFIGNGHDTGDLPSGTVSIANTNSSVIFHRDTTSDLVLSHNFSGPGVLQFYGVGFPDHSSYKLTGNSSGLTGPVVIGEVADTRPARLVVNSPAQLGTGEAVVFGGSTLYLNNNTYRNTFKIKGAGWAESSGAKGALRLNNADVNFPTGGPDNQILLEGNSSIYTDSGTSLINVPINGPFSLEKTGPGLLMLRNSNLTYTGGTVVSAGTLELGRGGIGNLPANSNLTVGSGAKFYVIDPDNSSKPLDTLTVTAGTFDSQGPGGSTSHYYDAKYLVMTGGTLYFDWSGLRLGKDVTINASSTTAVWNGGQRARVSAIGLPAGPQTISVAAGTTPNGIDLDSSTSLASEAGSSWVKAGPGVMRLTKVEFKLDLAVAAGKLRVDDIAILNGLTQGMGNSLTLNGGTLQFGGPTASSNPNALPLGSNHGTIEVMSGATTLTLTNLLSGSGALTKTGPGTLILAGTANNFTGGTVVNGGRLLVNNTSGTGTFRPVAVNSGGTLGGTGAITGTVTVNSGGHVAPGNSIESLDVGALVLNTGSILDFELGAPGSPGVTSDLINVAASGGLTIGGGSVALTNAGGLAAGTYTLIDYAGALDGFVASLGTPIGPGGFTYALITNATNTSIDLTVSAANLLGDYNLNGVVDTADYVVWRNNPGGFPPDAYATWRSHFGQPPGSGAGANANAAVPEPATIMLFIVAAVGGSARRRWRACRVSKLINA